MSECERTNCGYYYRAIGDDYSRCHYPDDGTPAPCEYPDEPEDIDDDCGYDSYTDDC